MWEPSGYNGVGRQSQVLLPPVRPRAQERRATRHQANTRLLPLDFAFDSTLTSINISVSSDTTRNPPRTTPNAKATNHWHKRQAAAPTPNRSLWSSQWQKTKEIKITNKEWTLKLLMSGSKSILKAKLTGWIWTTCKLAFAVLLVDPRLWTISFCCKTI